jgi:NodT family efflux transporter outer membrane factor (OMF) lipoprotein
MSRTFVLGVLALVAGCSVGPDYKRPEAPAPAAYKEDGWKPAEPKDAERRGEWWSIYQDTVLDGLERQIDISNQTLKEAEAAYSQAQAVVAEGQSGFWPTLSVTGAGTRSGQGGGGSTGVTTITGTPTVSPGRGSGSASSVNLSATASWDIDLWGKIRRTVESDVASAQASAADLANARLSAQGQLATLYFELRTSDQQQRLLDSAVQAFTQSLQITRNQYGAGVAAQTDVVTAETQLEQTRAQAIAVGVQRAQFEHAIAALIGKAPADFAVAPAAMPATVPVPPAELPSALLERRPDIAAAERLMAAANAQIGVAISAYYPDLTLSASYGFASSGVAKLLRASNSFWSLGPQLVQPIFTGGLTQAQVAAAKASYAQSVATYRQTVLTGFQQVEDQLAALRILAQQAVVEENTVRLAREAERLTLNQYQQGTVPYTAVITAETTRLTNEETALGILQSRFLASVALVQAVGGGWNTTQLPSTEQVKEDDPTPTQ